MLTGNDLLAKVRELGDAGKSEIVRECGYVSTKKDGGERLNFTAFYEALLDAKGVEIGGGSVGKGGRKLSYVATVFLGGDVTALTDDLRFASVAKFPNFGEQVVTLSLIHISEPTRPY